MKAIEELLSDDSAWPQAKEWLGAAVNPVTVLEPDIAERNDVLLPLQVSTRSTMGAIVYETGGLLVDHGWLRILGSGHRELSRNITAWNRKLAGTDDPTAGLLYIADDVLGGCSRSTGVPYPVLWGR